MKACGIALNIGMCSGNACEVPVAHTHISHVGVYVLR